MSNANVEITNDLLEKTLNNIIVHENKEAIVKLLLPLLSSSSLGVSYFIKFVLGAEYPKLPKIHDSGLVSIDKLSWLDRERQLIRDSEYNENDHVQVSITKINGLHQHAALEVLYPYSDENGLVSMKSTHIGIDAFIQDDFDSTILNVETDS